MKVREECLLSLVTLPREMIALISLFLPLSDWDKLKQTNKYVSWGVALVTDLTIHYRDIPRNRAMEIGLEVWYAKKCLENEKLLNTLFETVQQSLAARLAADIKTSRVSVLHAATEASMLYKRLPTIRVEIPEIKRFKQTNTSPLPPNRCCIL